MVRLLGFMFLLSTVIATCGISYAGDDSGPISPSGVKQGLEIAPVKLNLTGKDPAEVGLGSYLTNAVGDCSGYHSYPEYLEKGGPGSNPAAGDPFEGKPSTQSVFKQLVANFNSKHYLADGQCFGSYMARDLTPDTHGLPEGLTQVEFVKALRTGVEVYCEILAPRFASFRHRPLLFSFRSCHGPLITA
jgi:hypothetical protein